MAFSGFIVAAQAGEGHRVEDGGGACLYKDMSLMITSPKDNAFISGDSVALKHEKAIEGCDDHIHFYLFLAIFHVSSKPLQR